MTPPSVSLPSLSLTLHPYTELVGASSIRTRNSLPLRSEPAWTLHPYPELVAVATCRYRGGPIIFRYLHPYPELVAVATDLTASELPEALESSIRTQNSLPLRPGGEQPTCTVPGTCDPNVPSFRLSPPSVPRTRLPLRRELPGRLQPRDVPPSVPRTCLPLRLDPHLRGRSHIWLLHTRRARRSEFGCYLHPYPELVAVATRQTVAAAPGGVGLHPYPELVAVATTEVDARNLGHVFPPSVPGTRCRCDILDEDRSHSWQHPPSVPGTRCRCDP
jgi:hypothetical protein